MSAVTSKLQHRTGILSREHVEHLGSAVSLYWPAVHTAGTRHNMTETRRRSVLAVVALVVLVGLAGCVGSSGIGDVDDVLYPDGAGGSAQTTSTETGGTTSTAEFANDGNSPATETRTETATTGAPDSAASTSGDSEGSSSGSSGPADDTSTTSESDDAQAAECDRDVTRDDQSVAVLTCEMERHDDGSVTISGAVLNEGDTEVHDPGVYVRPYDAEGEMIQQGAYELYGRDLPRGPLEPGMTADYRVTFEKADAIDDFYVAGFDDVEAGLYESDRNVYWKAFDDVRREADDVLTQYSHQDSNGLVVYGEAEYVHDLYDVTYTVTVETEGEAVEKQINVGDADENGEVTFAVYFPDVTDDQYEIRVTGHGYTEPQDG